MLNIIMKYIIYKTTHKNGKYYIGRHATENLDDGYMGSGRWPSSIKNRNDLSREILEECSSMEDLIAAETRYLAEYYGKPGCMNMSPSSTGAAPGKDNPMANLDSRAKISGENHWSNRTPGKILRGDYHWMNTNPEAKQRFIDNHPNKDGAIIKKTNAAGRNIVQTNNPSIWRSQQGIHHWQNGNAPNTDGKLNKKLIDEGRHNLLGPEHNRRMIAEGKNPWVGSDVNNQRLAAGTHPSQMKKICEHCGVQVSVGMYTRWHGDNCKLKGEVK
jgi:hypothetical protein